MHRGVRFLLRVYETASISASQLDTPYYTNRRARVHKFLRVQNPPTPCLIPTAPPKFTIAPLRRFPPLREGNRARVRFSLLARRTLRRRSSIALVFVNRVHAIGIIHSCFCELWLGDWLSPTGSRSLLDAARGFPALQCRASPRATDRACPLAAGKCPSASGSRA